jgi:integrase
MTDVAEPALPKRERRVYIPHAFTDEELANFFSACDSLPWGTTHEQHSRKLTVPVFFRLLYSSGMRTTEARMLAVGDVDLNGGVIDVRRSKGYDQHYVVLHDEMAGLMSRYDAAISSICPDRHYFFPARNNGFHNRCWVQDNFRELWRKHNGSHATAYELRHHYAVSNINRWTDEGFGFDAKLAYLSKSMGHTTLESTRYYYSLVPALADVLEAHCTAGFDDMVPEVANEGIQ